MIVVAAGTPTSVAVASAGTMHRIGGGSVENLRLKPAEAAMDIPGISALESVTPGEAADSMRAAFPTARKLHETTKTVGSARETAIRSAGFDIMPDPTRNFPNHYRVTHPDGVAGFNDVNLAKLA